MYEAILILYPNHKCVWAAHTAETLFAECGERGNPLGSNEVHQAVTKKKRRGPGPSFVVCASTGALALRSSWTTSAWPSLAAECSGVKPQSGAHPVDKAAATGCAIM